MFNSRKLKEIRNAHHMTQKETAKLFNISAQALSHYERGSRTPNIDFLKQFAKVFSLSDDELTKILFDEILQDAYDPYNQAPDKAVGSFTILTPAQIQELPINELFKIKDYAEYIYLKHKQTLAKK